MTTTAGAVAANPGMVKGTGRYPEQGAVAIFTVISTVNMLCVFARGSKAVVANGTGAEYFIVVQGYQRLPRSHRMAASAQVRGGDMPCGFAAGTETVMTRPAGTTNLVVVYVNNGYPGIG